MNTVECHCGAVAIELRKRPEEVFECSCSICRRLGALWAYYSLDQVDFVRGTDQTNVYTWNKHWIQFHSCATCGCTTHWRPTDPEETRRMGVNARLIDGLNPSNTGLKHFDGGDNGCFWTRESD